MLQLVVAGEALQRNADIEFQPVQEQWDDFDLEHLLRHLHLLLGKAQFGSECNIVWMEDWLHRRTLPVRSEVYQGLVLNSKLSEGSCSDQLV